MNRVLEKIVFPVALSLTVFLSASTLAFAESESGKTEQLPVIQIEVISQLHEFGVSANYAYFSPYEEYLKFADLLKKKLQPFHGDFEFIVKRFPSKNDPTFPEIRVYLNDWRAYRSGEIRAILGVKVAWNETTESIGVFRGDAVMVPATIRSLRDQRYDEAMNKAVVRMLEKLEPYFGKWKKGVTVSHD